MNPEKNIKEPKFSRRDIIRKTASACGLAVGASLWGYVFYNERPTHKKATPIHTLKDFRAEPSSVYPQLAIAHGKNVHQIVNSAISDLGGISRFIQPGETVLIKPNAAWDRQPQQGANTNPLVVAAMVKLCRDARAGSIIVNDVTINDAYRTFFRSGIEDAVQQAGGEIVYAASDDFLPTDMKGDILKVWPVFNRYHSVDRVINIPTVKHHSLSGSSLSMKNWYGVLGGRRNRLHQDIHLSIADLATAIRPTLTLMDATRVLKQNGPTGGNISDVSIENTVMAGIDEVAIDAWAMGFLDMTPKDTPYIQIAQERGLGVANWRSLNVKRSQTG